MQNSVYSQKKIAPYSTLGKKVFIPINCFVSFPDNLIKPTVGAIVETLHTSEKGKISLEISVFKLLFGCI